MMSRTVSTQPTFIDDGSIIITKPKELANHLSVFFRDKVSNLRKAVGNRIISPTTDILK